MLICYEFFQNVCMMIVIVIDGFPYYLHLDFGKNVKNVGRFLNNVFNQ